MNNQIHSSLKVLLVSDLEKSKAFYRDVLGCEVTDWWAIRDGLTGLGVKLLQAISPEDVYPNRKPAPDIYCYVENWTALDELYEEFKAKGAKMVVEPWIDPESGPWKEFALVDPDNYCLAFGGTNGK
ncbi:VOC family protein [Paenibacillus sp. BSR1-1]|uniref:VOC family protein n=1 Tax=Paenibacillus sp. BSR1-1 TaxID=3020845 RepID=UPI0025AFECF5|nr:VOC family protein [Paenibacillus sp. BSR1-1]MDN3018393.1 VOC family protein [Paenibacillus sp. BSR1-1]